MPKATFLSMKFQTTHVLEKKSELCYAHHRIWICGPSKKSSALSHIRTSSMKPLKVEMTEIDDFTMATIHT